MTSLNPLQQRSVLLGCLDIHRRLAEMEAILGHSQTPTPFSLYTNDLSPTERKVVQDYFARLRATMLVCLQEAGIPLDVRCTSARWALQCGISFVDVAVSDMGPRQLAGYGTLTPEGEALARKIQQELRRPLDRVRAYLQQGLGRDLPQRLARLEAASAGVADLALLEKAITRWGLVEFQPQLDLIVRRLEAPQFEMAVFGRVSSGKSSLLNHLAGMNVLPVGITPVTAVPTRLVRGDGPAAVISFAEVEPRTVPVQELHAYASEEGNPGNHKHVTGILVRLPSPRLREGVVLVDTPGIGSLARSGGAETFAYLPHCDLGVVLIDAASTLTPDDLDLLRLLYEAGVPAQVVLSKADLLTPADRRRTAEYVREQIQRELGIELAVHPVSTVGADEALLTRWFEEEIEPLLARHRSLTEQSLRRKTAHLRESVIAVLQTLPARRNGGASCGRAPVPVGAVKPHLDRADEAVRWAKLQCRDWRADVPALVEVIVRDAARTLVAGTSDSAGGEHGPVLAALQRVLRQRDQMGQELVTRLQQDLSQSLQSLQEAMPLAPADPASVRNLALRGLPAPDVSGLRTRLRCDRPWWTALLPGAARWAMEHALRKRLESLLREQVESHDRQLQAWLRACVQHVVELYEAQTQVFRVQARRRSGDAGDMGGAPDAQELQATLRELRQSEAPESNSASGARP
jgi:GTP-binding protein EngB required for normal cell division